MNKFNVGDTVVLLVDRQYSNGDTIAAGTKGIIKKVYQTWGGYYVYFYEVDQSKRVAEKFLA